MGNSPNYHVRGDIVIPEGKKLAWQVSVQGMEYDDYLFDDDDVMMDFLDVYLDSNIFYMTQPGEKVKLEVSLQLVNKEEFDVAQELD